MLKNLFHYGTLTVLFLSFLLGIGLVGALRQVPVEGKGDVLTDASSHPQDNPPAMETGQIVPSFEEYEAAFGQRDIFQIPEQGRSASSPSSLNGAQDAGVFDQKYVIVGILVDRHSKVVVQDKQTRQTFFLSEGEMLDGIAVEQILPQTVIFDRDGKRFEMKLDL